MMVNKKDFSTKQETTIANKLGWRRVSGSGSRPLACGDVVSDTWLGECKTHVDSGHAIRFDLNVWRKLQDEAISKFKYPVLFVDDGSQLLANTFVMFPKNCLDYYHGSLLDYPKAIRSNVSFKIDELDWRNYNSYTLKFGDRDVCICKFSTFLHAVVNEV